MRIIEPVIIRPWLAEWETTKTRISTSLERQAATQSAAAQTRRRQEAERLLADFLKRLRAFTVLDPACGSGNFLYLALQAIKDLEHRVQLEAEVLGLPRGFPETGPANVKGIEINPYAAELARVSVWIGEIQWMRRNGFAGSRDPILKPLDTIECRDAVLSPKGDVPEWPEADAVIGNPPFLGSKRMREVLGDAYTECLRQSCAGTVPSLADLVCYWFQRANELGSQKKIARCGLVATNSIRNGRSRVVLDRIVEQGTIFDAWSDESWVVDGAAVRVSIVCFTSQDIALPVHLDGKSVSRINSDLTSGIDVTKAKELVQNRQTAFVGAYKKGGFDIAGNLAREWLRLPMNPNGRPRLRTHNQKITVAARQMAL